MTADDWQAGYELWNPRTDGTGYTDVYRIAYHAGWVAGHADTTTD